MQHVIFFDNERFMCVIPTSYVFSPKRFRWAHKLCTCIKLREHNLFSANYVALCLMVYTLLFIQIISQSLQVLFSNVYQISDILYINLWQASIFNKLKYGCHRVIEKASVHVCKGFSPPAFRDIQFYINSWRTHFCNLFMILTFALR